MNARFKKELEQLIPALNEEIEALHEQSKNPCYLEGESNMKQMIEQLDAKEETFKGLEARAEKYNNWQAVLETNATQFDNLDALKEDLGARCLLWRSLRDWQAYTSKALETNFQEIEAEDVKLEAERYAKDVARLQKTLEDNPIQRKLKDLVDTFRGAMPIVVALRRPQLEGNHWEEINELVGQPIDIAAEGFTLQSLVDMNVVPYQEEIEAIATRAIGEAKLNTAFAELETKWKGCELIMETYKEREGVYQLKYIDDLYECIDDCLAQINMILGNRFVGFMRKICEKMKKEIQNANAIVTVWVECQREWMYLENIFTQSKELISALPNEKKMFDAVNVFFIKEISLKAQQRSRLVGFVKLPKITEEAIKGQVMLLGQVRKGLESYMEQKRDAFPRFYFLSDDEVLEILAKSDQMDIIQQYLKQMFDGIVKVTIENESDITQMRSKEGEHVPLSQKVKVSKEVDVYLDKLQEMMVSSLQKQMKNALTNYMTMDRKEWVMDKKHFG
jgi:dynein heavy chain